MKKCTSFLLGMVVLVYTKVSLLFLKFQSRPFKSYDFSNMGSLDVKPVSLICKMLPQTFSNSTLSWDCPFNSRISKQFNIGSKALENMIRAYCSLKLRSFCFFYWTMGNWSADRLYLPTTACVLPKTLDEIS
jgi:hypothetical protein